MAGPSVVGLRVPESTGALTVDANRGIAPTDEDVFDPGRTSRRPSARQDLGMRIDLVLASQPVAARVRAAWVDRQPRKDKGPSDHAPVIVDLDEVPDGDIGPARRMPYSLNIVSRVRTLRSSWSACAIRTRSNGSGW
jgi:hypothetical protein